MKPKLRKLLDWLSRSSPLLERQIIASGMSSTLNDALRDGFADMGADPVVKERGAPAACVRITEAGKRALETKKAPG